MQYRQFLISMVLGVVLAVLRPYPAHADALADVMQMPSRAVADPAAVTLVDVTRAGNRLVAVGERGVILLSDDNGGSWHQVPAPVSVTLTAVRFITAQEGWAVGHSGIVLHSGDGGRTWSKQLDGVEAASLLLAAAPPAAAAAGAGASAVVAKRRLAQQFVDDGPDKPFLDICFAKDGTTYVAGAYGLIFASRDHGRTWQPWLDHVDNPEGLNLYAMKRSGDALYLAGEQGYFARSLDNGQHFQRLATPYQGSYFTLGSSPPEALVVAGLRGNILASSDGGTTWQAVAHAGTVSFDAITTLTGGTLLLANQRGELLASRDEGHSFEAVNAKYVRLPTAALVEAADGSIVTVGVRGINHFTLADYR
ncbi:YCF48-related protein [Paraburkholderia sediminicola]|uniref:WD40/YVTN/BNR-like repeat-containing protein n=1 Tax=Paraburkholderia sediminicola TaxID=458836 RepID=UPI0038B99322